MEDLIEIQLGRSPIEDYEETEYREWLPGAVERILARQLDPRSREAFMMRHGLRGDVQTQLEVGAVLGISRGRVVQLVNKAHARVDGPLRDLMG